MQIRTLTTLDKLTEVLNVSRGTLLSWLSHFTLSKYLYKIDRQYHFILNNGSREALYRYFLLKKRKRNDIILRSKLYNIEGFKRKI